MRFFFQKIFWETCDFGKKKQVFVLFNIFKFAISSVHILDLVKCRVTPPKETLFRFYIAWFFYRFMKSKAIVWAPVIDQTTFAFFFIWREADCIPVGYLHAQGNHALHRINQAGGQRGITSFVKF